MCICKLCNTFNNTYINEVCGCFFFFFSPPSYELVHTVSAFVVILRYFTHFVLFIILIFYFLNKEHHIFILFMYVVFFRLFPTQTHPMHMCSTQIILSLGNVCSRIERSKKKTEMWCVFEARAKHKRFSFFRFLWICTQYKNAARIVCVCVWM